MYETCTLESVVHEFDDIIQGGPYETPEKEQTPDYFDEDHLYLAILRAMWKFKCNIGNLANPPSVQLINHIMNSIPNLKISKAEVREKIKEFEDTFYEVRQMNVDNPAMHQLMDQEIFYLFMQLWVKSEEAHKFSPILLFPGNTYYWITMNLKNISSSFNYED
ncbi:hypothetical protein BC332_32199 [Capsicum chinense]|nr:hypothetical protein BC332_32199 [Capsicum chinense]